MKTIEELKIKLLRRKVKIKELKEEITSIHAKYIETLGELCQIKKCKEDQAEYKSLYLKSYREFNAYRIAAQIKIKDLLSTNNTIHILNTNPDDAVVVVDGVSYSVKFFSQIENPKENEVILTFDDENGTLKLTWVK